MSFLVETAVALRLISALPCRAQEAWSQMSAEVVATLGVDTSREAIWCGVALGYADTAAPVNSLQTERAPLKDFVTFRGGALEELQPRKPSSKL